MIPIPSLAKPQENESELFKALRVVLYLSIAKGLENGFEVARIADESAKDMLPKVEAYAKGWGANTLKNERKSVRDFLEGLKKESNKELIAGIEMILVKYDERIG